MSIPVAYLRSVRSAEGLVAAVERAVAEHAVGPGDRLPTVRELSSRLDLAPGTVASAYRTLAQRGIVTSRGRQGTLVSAGPSLPSRPAPALPPGVRNLADGNPDPALLPSWSRALRRLATTPVRYGDPDVGALIDAGTAGFAHDGVPTERCVVVHGALDGMERVLGAHFRPGDRVAVEDPGFPRVFDLVAALGLVAVPVAVDARGLQPDALARALRDGASAVVVTPRAQNPTGAALDDARVSALRAVLAKHPDALVIEDDHAGPVSGAPAHTLVHRRRARWAVLRSVAKSLGPDLRLALLAGDRVTLDRVEGRLRVGPGWVSHLLQDLVVELWGDPAVHRTIEHAAATYGQRRDALVAALTAQGVASTGVSGLNVWVPVPEEAPVVAGLLARGWAVAAGERFCLRREPAVRITTATLAPRDASRLAQDLASALVPGRGAATGV